jgi:tetratricopeptide (TPR) repeat protein
VSRFEAYKEALRRGHVAVLQGNLDEALAAYREASTFAPDRPLPWTSLASVLHRLGRPNEALAAYDRALDRSPDDEGALRARQAIVEELLAGGITPAPHWPEADDLESAPPVPLPEPAAGGTADDVTDWPAIDLPTLPVPAPVGPPPDIRALTAEADALIDGGDIKAARDLLLTALEVHREAGRLDAAIDVGLQLLAHVPGDPQLHLALANLQLDEDWRPVAVEKLELLIRLTQLSGDIQAAADAHMLASDRLRDVVLSTSRTIAPPD